MVHRRLLVCAPLALCLAMPVLAAERPQLLPGRSNAVNHVAPSSISVQTATATELIQCLLGSGVTVTNVQLTAAGVAAGLFSGGAGSLGIDQGIVLSTGNISSIVGPNFLDETSTDNGLPGDADLGALVPGYTTNDAAVLEFDFSCVNTTTISFEYVFASEEYNEWVNSNFNDVFGFFLNGVNIATVPAACSSPGIPVTIDNVNCGNPYVPAGGTNCGCYRNNDLTDGGGSIDTEMDGLTQVFYATGTINPGLNHMKLAIADAGDFALDSNVMIRCQSFSCEAPPLIGGCCIGSQCFLLGQAQCSAQGGAYLGDNSDCSGSPCTTGTHKQSWGQLKTIYR